MSDGKTTALVALLEDFEETREARRVFRDILRGSTISGSRRPISAEQEENRIQGLMLLNTSPGVLLRALARMTETGASDGLTLFDANNVLDCAVEHGVDWEVVRASIPSRDSRARILLGRFDLASSAFLEAPLDDIFAAVLLAVDIPDAEEMPSGEILHLENSLGRALALQMWCRDKLKDRNDYDEFLDDYTMGPLTIREWLYVGLFIDRADMSSAGDVLEPHWEEDHVEEFGGIGQGDLAELGLDIALPDYWVELERIALEVFGADSLSDDTFHVPENLVAKRRRELALRRKEMAGESTLVAAVKKAAAKEAEDLF